MSTRKTSKPSAKHSTIDKALQDGVVGSAQVKVESPNGNFMYCKVNGLRLYDRRYKFGGCHCEEFAATHKGPFVVLYVTSSGVTYTVPADWCTAIKEEKEINMNKDSELISIWHKKQGYVLEEKTVIIHQTENTIACVCDGDLDDYLSGRLYHVSVYNKAEVVIKPVTTTVTINTDDYEVSLDQLARIKAIINETKEIV